MSVIDLSTKNARSLVVAQIREALDREVWELCEDDPETERRSCYLGSVMNIFPSGKYYTPWACSNVAPCPSCDGRGHIRSKLGRRREKKVRVWLAHNVAKLRGLDRDSLRAQHIREQNSRVSRLLNESRRCGVCRGHGSAEIWRDARFSDALTALCDSQNWSLESGEGDLCDLFVVEYRQKE